MSAPAWVELLQKHRVRDVIDPHRKLVTAKYNEEVTDLLKRLSDAHVLSAVVVDDQRPGVWGFVDVLDLLHCVVSVTSESKDITKESLRNVKWEGQCFGRQMSGMLVNISRSNPYETVSMDTPLMDAVKILSIDNHRVAVTEKERVLNILSQSDIVNFLATRGVYVGSKMMQPIVEAGLAPLGVASVLDTVNVLDCIKFMAQHKLSAVPVVDKEGKIVSNFSASDLLGLNENNFQYLQHSVKDFLHKMHGFPKPPVTCTTTDTLESVLLRMVVHKVHRVYVVPPTMKPSGVISMTDIMQVLLAY
jgi:CBS domain-containing protein